MGFRPMLTSVTWAVLYHAGSLALGSLILMIVWPIRFFFQYVHGVLTETYQDRKIKSKFSFKCIKCFIGFISVLVRFSNKHAYTEIALKSSSYFVAAHNGFKIVGSNVMKLGVLHGVNEYVFFLGQVLVTSIVMLSAYITFYAVNLSVGKENKVNEIAFLTVCLALSWSATSLFSSLWNTVSSTLLHCYCIDEEAHKFDGQGAKYASDKLLYALRDLKPGHRKIIGATF